MVDFPAGLAGLGAQGAVPGQPRGSAMDRHAPAGPGVQHTWIYLEVCKYGTH